jgi:hypothetical protein
VKIGITGHRDLTALTVTLVSSALEERLTQVDGLVGITALAEGADQLFARVVIACGGTLDVIVPSEAYRGLRDDLASYDHLLGRAVRVTRLPFAQDGPAAHVAAGLVMVERCDQLLAVWDGQPARSFGGTADFVDYARQIKVPVVVLWPPGSARRSR